MSKLSTPHDCEWQNTSKILNLATFAWVHWYIHMWFPLSVAIFPPVGHREPQQRLAPKAGLPQIEKSPQGAPWTRGGRTIPVACWRSNDGCFFPIWATKHGIEPYLSGENMFREMEFFSTSPGFYHYDKTFMDICLWYYQFKRHSTN